METKEFLSTDFETQAPRAKSIRKIDSILLLIVSITVIGGFAIFSSAAQGLHARQGGASFEGALESQLLGIGVGILALIGASFIPYTFWRKSSFYLFILTSLLMIAVVIPGLGFFHGGSSRWLQIGPLSIQPADFFKIAVVFLYGAYISKLQKHITDIRSQVPFWVLLAISMILLHLQPKYGTILVIGAALFSMLILSGSKLKHILLVPLILLPLGAALISSVPYVQERFVTFFHKEKVNVQDEGYQINQSLIAIGSGGLTGRGYGMSLQKFNFIPEQTSDSIFAVAAEEFGFIGSVVIVILIALFVFRCLVIASKAPDLFARLLVVGLAILIASQSFLNIAAMVELFPISGMPLVFVSHGGTAMLTALGSVGIILNVSKYSKL